MRPPAVRRDLRRRRIGRVDSADLGFGSGWTLLVLAATFMAGVVLAASQLRGRSDPPPAPQDPQAAVTDGVLVGLGRSWCFFPAWSAPPPAR